MADIFLSYARDDQARTEPIVSALEGQGWSVFWDRRIPAGKTWRSHIGKALDAARCVVVAWSRDSVESDWVIEEADVAKRRGVLVPILLDRVEPPMGLREIQAADLTGWDADPASPRFRQLLDDIRAVLSPAPWAPVPERPPDLLAPTTPSGLHPERESRTKLGMPSKEYGRTKAIVAVLGSLGVLALLGALLLTIWTEKSTENELYRTALQDIERMKARQDDLEETLRRIGATAQEIQQVNEKRTALERSFTSDRLEITEDQAAQLADIYEQKLRGKMDETILSDMEEERARRTLERELNELRELSGKIKEIHDSTTPIRNTR